jgi:hypothetical protein
MVFGMRCRRAATLIAVVFVFVQDVLWPFGVRAGTRVANCRVLAPARRWVASLPAVAALPLFLVPEICSRLGTFASAWLLLQGDVWRALAVYVATKLFAGMTALWIYTACLPALMQVRAFAAVHDVIVGLRQVVVDTLRAKLPGRRCRIPAPPVVPP